MDTWWHHRSRYRGMLCFFCCFIKAEESVTSYFNCIGFCCITLTLLQEGTTCDTLEGESVYCWRSCPMLWWCPAGGGTGWPSEDSFSLLCPTTSNGSRVSEAQPRAARYIESLSSLQNQHSRYTYRKRHSCSACQYIWPIGWALLP